MRYSRKGCVNLASAVINQAMEDYQIPSMRPEIQTFLFSDRFRMFVELAGWNVGLIRRAIMQKDCRTCKNRYKEHLCIMCYETDPTKVHNYYEKDDRKPAKRLKK